MDKIFEFKSNGKYRVTLNEHFLTIDQKGFCNFVNRGLVGAKTIYLKDISAVQFKKVGFATTGYIQFVIRGSQEVKGGLMSATKDENTILFRNSKENQMAWQLKCMIEEYKCNMNNSNKINFNQSVVSGNNSNNTIISELERLGKLRKEGILTEEEFREQKYRVLHPNK